MTERDRASTSGPNESASANATRRSASTGTLESSGPVSDRFDASLLDRTSRATELAGEPLANTLTEWSRVVAETLLASGVELAIVSPGSRSTPYLAALLRVAERSESLARSLRVLDVVDERSAAFVALGAARTSGRPVALLCTSGTAPAHWFPAVLEASLARIPLVLLSADRPTELMHCGAAQTLDQTKLFGDHVRHFVDPGNPESSLPSLVGLRRAITQAVARALGPDPGPVHINLRARKPLEPRAATSAAELALVAKVDALLATPLPRIEQNLALPATQLDAVAMRIARAERPLFVAGPLPVGVDVAAVRSLVARASGVLFAEVASQLRTGAGSDDVVQANALEAWLRAGLLDRPAYAPDLVVQLGATPTNAALERWLGRAKPTRVVLGVPDWIDPQGTAEEIVIGDVGALAAALAARTSPRSEPSVWARALAEIDAEGERIARSIAGAWSEAHIARAVLESDLERLVIGNSLPIRMVDRFAPRDVRAPVEVVHQRGANGIDGFLAQSFGAQLARPLRTVALLGDLTFLHDVGSLASARRSSSPLVVVVVANGGGRIFETLPVARDAAWAMPHFVTEQEFDLASLAAAFGVAHRRATDPSALAEALSFGLGRSGLTLVEAVVPPHGAVELDRMLAERSERALAMLGI